MALFVLGKYQFLDALGVLYYMGIMHFHRGARQIDVFKTPVTTANTWYRKGLSQNQAAENPRLSSYIFPWVVEAGWRPLPGFPHPAFRENFPTWERGTPIYRAPLYVIK
jgi:hypothetical protein